MTITRILSATALVVSCVALGLTVGGFVASRFLAGPQAMGWDRLADALGGAMVGVLAGGGIGAWAVRRTSHRQRWRWAAWIFIGAVLTVVYMRANPIGG